MRKGIIATLLVGASTGVGLVVAATRHEEVAAPGAKVGPIVVAGLNKEAAAKKIRTWWEMEKMRDIKLLLPLIHEVPFSASGTTGIYR
jgi:hypothetical protein